MIVGASAFLVLVGLFGQFATRALIVNGLDIGHAMLLAAAMGGGAALTRREPGSGGLLASTLAGATAGVGLALLVAIVRIANLRWIFISLMPVTLNRIGYGLPDGEAAGWLALGGAVAAALGSVCVLAPVLVRRIILGALGGVVVAGLLRELIRSLVGEYGGIEGWGISFDGVLPPGAPPPAVFGGVPPGGPGPGRNPPVPHKGRAPVR